MNMHTAPKQILSISRLAYATFLAISLLTPEICLSDDIHTTEIQIQFDDDRKLFAIVGDMSLKILPEGVYFRLWGAEVIKTPPTSLFSDTYHCDVLGRVYVSGFGSANIKQCRNSSIDLAEALILDGFALEICSETNNAYGTCK